MRFTSTLALGLALAAAGLAQPALARDKKADAADQGAPKIKLTPAVQNNLAAAQTAIKANDFATAQTKVEAAKPAIATAQDKFYVGQVEYQLGKAKQDEALQTDGMTLMVDSGQAPPALQQQLLTVQAQTAYNAKNFPLAVQKLQAAQAAGADDPALVPMLVQSMQNSGQTVQALQALNAAIDANTQAGKPVPSEWYQRGFSIGYQASSKASAGDAPQIAQLTSDITRKWVAAYPAKGNWHDALVIYSTQYKVPTDVQVDVFRLMRAVGALTSDADYREYAEDVYLRYPNEAMTVLQEGNSKGIVNLTGKNDATEVLGIVKGKVAADKASLAPGEKSARVAANGKSAMGLGDAYAGYGEWAKAADLYKVAIDKGGVDVPTATLRMGWAQAMAGNTAAAKTSFGAVTGIRQPLAQFWLVHLDHPTQG
jgi:tetratricopeptide (TPR) repeat protein